MKVYHLKFKPYRLQVYFHSTTSSRCVNNSDPISHPYIHISSSSQFHILNHLQNSRDWKGCKHDEQEKISMRKFCQVQFTNHQIHFLSFPLVVSHTTQQLYQSFPSFAVANRTMMTTTTQSKRIFSLFVVVIAEKIYISWECQRWIFDDIEIKLSGAKICKLKHLFNSTYRCHLHVVKRIICNWCNIKKCSSQALSIKWNFLQQQESRSEAIVRNDKCHEVHQHQERRRKWM